MQTRQLKNLLERYEAELSAADFVSFRDEVNRRQFEYENHLFSFLTGYDRGREVQRLVDEQVDLSANIKTSCQKGCSACCHYEVEITSDDAAVLRQSILSNSDLNFNMRALVEQSLRLREDEIWKRGMVAENRCAFLGADNSCMNYENRPATCRKHAVVSPTVECETADGAVVQRTLPIAEILLSAAISLPSVEFGSVSKMLIKLLEAKTEDTTELQLDL